MITHPTRPHLLSVRDYLFPHQSVFHSANEPIDYCYQKVLNTSPKPVAYWPFDEAGGSVAYCLRDPNQDAAITGATVREAGIGDGGTSYLFDGVNDHVNLYTATLNARLSGTFPVGTVAGWAKIYENAAWTDGEYRRIFSIHSATNPTTNYWSFYKHATAGGTLVFQHNAGGTQTWVSGKPSGFPTLDWWHFAVSVDTPADEAKVHINGAQISTTQSGIGTWQGAALEPTRVLVGALSVGTGVWHGWLAHPAIWTTPLSDATILDLATVI